MIIIKENTQTRREMTRTTDTEKILPLDMKNQNNLLLKETETLIIKIVIEVIEEIIEIQEILMISRETMKDKEMLLMIALIILIIGIILINKAQGDRLLLIERDQILLNKARFLF